MAGASLLALLDDIATLLDDVAVMTKVAAKKTAGVLGDDLALNAEQVNGVRAERELPVVWAVGVGSLKNKAILVPAALAISALAPWLITPLLMLGGLYLCFEGVEKLAHSWLHGAEEDASEHARQLAAVADEQVDLVAMEKDKIQGAIRTDFVLSAEIIVIALGTVADKSFAMQCAVLAGVAVLLTIGVYGLVAATNRDLAQEVAAGRFRQDLYYRLQVMEIELPALRERPEDIPELINHFTRQLAGQLGVPPVHPDAASLRRLQGYDWPGNVRELRNLVERSLIFGYYDLKPEPASAAAEAGAALPAQPEVLLEAVEKRHILAVLNACGGNKSEAARQLGVSRKTLDRKCNAWGV